MEFFDFGDGLMKIGAAIFLTDYSMDPFATLSAAAATERLLVGTAICLVVQLKLPSGARP